jgi:hypothetical protein
MSGRVAPRRAKQILAALAAAIVLVFLVSLLAATQGHFVPQVSDLYLVCQYARAIAEGHPFRYNPGDPPSTGATSLLHTALLAAAHAAGFRGEGLIAFAVLSGALFFVAAVLCARRAGEALAGPREGLLSGGLVALGGPVAWGFLYGADVALAMLLSVWLFDRLLAEWTGPSITWGVVAASLLALTRPEALLTCLVLGVAWSLGPARGARGARRVIAWLPALAGIAVAALYRVVAGSWLGSSVADKSMLVNYGLADTVSLVSEYLLDVLRGLLLGFYPSQTPVGFARGWAPLFFPPLGLLTVAVVVALPRERLKAPVRAWVLIVAAVWIAMAPNTFMGVHFNRYLLWAFPSLLVLCAAGLGRLTRLWSPGDEARERMLFRVGAGLFLACGLLSTLRMAMAYGEMAGEVYRRDVAAARWIAANLPQGVAIANLATSVEYLTGHRNVNLHGVTSPAFFGNRTAEREAGMFESLARLKPDERPPYLMTTASTQAALKTLPELVDGAPIYRTSSFGDEIFLFRMRYDLVDGNTRLRLPSSLEATRGRTEVDRLNVCDSRDEEAHHYSFDSRLGNLRLHGTARVDSYSLGESPPEALIDAGRVILGREAFAIRASPGRDIVGVLRTAANVSANVYRASGNGELALEIAEAAFVLRVDGETATQLAFRPRAGWDEVVFRVPASLIRREQPRFEIEGRYAAYQYWFFQ